MSTCPDGRCSRFSACRVGWSLSLLACCAFIVNAVWTYGRHREWWTSVQAEQLRYAQWTTVAHRDVRAMVGDVEGLSREQVAERLRARLGPDDPYPTRVTGVVHDWELVYGADPLREPAVAWAVRGKNWNVIVTIYDGRADQLIVQTLKPTFYGPRLPREYWKVPLYTMVASWIAMPLAAAAAIVLWCLRLNHRAAIHVSLMATAIGSAALLFTDWQMGAGLGWRPLVLSGKFVSVPWEGAALGLVFGLIALRVPARRPVPGICPNCRYDLRGNVSGICPECGTAISAPPQSVAPAAPAMQ
jgi:hypothetical protein